MASSFSLHSTSPGCTLLCCAHGMVGNQELKLHLEYNCDKITYMKVCPKELIRCYT